MILQDLKDCHKGEEIWVCGSGPSMDWVTPQFFDDKVVVSINDVGFWFGIVTSIRRQIIPKPIRSQANG
jgi:hypothetical protein